MRPSQLVRGALLLSLAATACRWSDDTRRGTFRGIFVSAFETSAFRPCGESRVWWWLAGDLTEVYGAWDGDPLPPDRTQVFYVRVRGERSRPGGHGHLNSYPYALVVEEVLEARTDTAGACR